ncbi:hypothetical protein BRC65_01140 [Halobacteriales archaeon QH_2_65_14]|nr:MAG: hypothetical protein BRC65_01140 [Halobacteriales archaeon QH_2_65_14]
MDSAVCCAVVTAVGSGIGEACARRLTEDGYTPVLLSRSGSAVEVAKELGGDGFEGSVTTFGAFEMARSEE